MIIMQPTHPRWEEFCERLGGPDGCNFRKNESGDLIWDCRGGFDKTKSRAILETIPEIDVDGSLDYFEKHGGHCDCEVLFNITSDSPA